MNAALLSSRVNRFSSSGSPLSVLLGVFQCYTVVHLPAYVCMTVCVCMLQSWTWRVSALCWVQLRTNAFNIRGLKLCAYKQQHFAPNVGKLLTKFPLVCCMHQLPTTAVLSIRNTMGKCRQTDLQHNRQRCYSYTPTFDAEHYVMKPLAASMNACFTHLSSDLSIYGVHCEFMSRSKISRNGTNRITFSGRASHCTVSDVTQRFPNALSNGEQPLNNYVLMETQLSFFGTAIIFGMVLLLHKSSFAACVPRTFGSDNNAHGRLSVNS